jgi:hypothetical protein
VTLSDLYAMPDDAFSALDPERVGEALEVPLTEAREVVRLVGEGRAVASAPRVPGQGGDGPPGILGLVVVFGGLARVPESLRRDPVAWRPVPGGRPGGA